jgi:hypothetical protein
MKKPKKSAIKFMTARLNVSCKEASNVNARKIQWLKTHTLNTNGKENALERRAMRIRALTP